MEIKKGSSSHVRDAFQDFIWNDDIVLEESQLGDVWCKKSVRFFSFQVRK